MPLRAAKEPKPKKDPNAPKKPSGAYIFYCKAKRAEVKKEHPDYTVGQVGKALGEMWKQEPEAVKKPFYDLAEADKMRYSRQLAEYNKALT